MYVYIHPVTLLYKNIFIYKNNLLILIRNQIKFKITILILLVRVVPDLVVL